MKKIAFMFPGQGSQYVGMGQDFYENSETAKEVFGLASKSTGLEMESLCFEENEKINITEYTQAAILAAEAAILKVFEETTGIHPDVCAGLSLGEYGALIASGVLSLKDAFYVIRKRGIFMQEAVPTGGAMSAVLGLDAQKIEEICNHTEGLVSIANYNCPGQIVITGESGAVEAAAEAMKEAGAKRVVPLKVSGPFHSKMLTDAGERLGKVLDEVTISDIRVPYIANYTADYVTDSSMVKELLVKQVSGSVRWQQTIERFLADGVDTFVEIGPGKTLSGFMRKIDRSVSVYNIEKWEDMEKAAEKIKA